jgi:hypothetical protein
VLDVAPLIDEYGVTVQLVRYPTVTIDELGETQFEADDPVDVLAAIVPLRGRSLSRLPSADREREGIEVYTRENLALTDVITYRGRNYEVTQTHDYTTAYMAIALLEVL